MYSHVVPDHSTDMAVTGLTSQIGRDAVLLSAYGRSCVVCGLYTLDCAENDGMRLGRAWCVVAESLWNFKTAKTVVGVYCYNHLVNPDFLRTEIVLK